MSKDDFGPHVALAKKHLPKEAANREFADWLNWSAALGFLVTVYDNEKDKNILGLAIARPITDTSKIPDSYAYDHNGRYVHIDLAIAPTKQILRAVGIGIIQKFGQRELLSSEHKKTLKVRSYGNACRALFR